MNEQLITQLKELIIRSSEKAEEYGLKAFNAQGLAEELCWRLLASNSENVALELQIILSKQENKNAPEPDRSGATRA